MGAEGIGFRASEVVSVEPKSTIRIIAIVEILVSFFHIVPGSIRILLR